MVLNSGNFCQINFFRFLLPHPASTASNRKGVKYMEQFGFLSIYSTKNGCFGARSKRYIDINPFFEEKKTFKPIEAMEAVEAVEAKEVENVAEVKKSLITSIPSIFSYFLKSKRQSRSSRSLRFSWLMRSLRPVRSSGSLMYSNLSTR